MKKRRFCSLLLSALLLLTSCTRPQESPQSQLPLPETVKMKADPGTLFTVMNEVRRITGYEFMENENPIVLTPSVCIGEDAVYLYRHYSDEESLAILEMNEAEEDAHFDTREWDTVFEIEVYEDITASDPSRTFELKDLPDCQLTFHDIHYLYDSDTLLILFSEKHGDTWSVWLYTFDLDGNLLSRIPRPELDWNRSLSYTDSYFFVDNAIYYQVQEPYNIMAQTYEYRIHRYDLTTGEDIILDTEATAGMFMSKGKLYYFTNTYDEYGFADKINLVRLDGEESVVIHRNLSPAWRVPLNADYDEERKILYFSDAYNLYSYHIETGISYHLASSGDKLLADHGITNGVILLSNGSYALSVYELPTDTTSLSDYTTTLNLFLRDDTENDNPFPEIFQIMTNNGYLASGHSTGISNRDDYQFTLAKKLLAGDTDFDIFYVSSEMSDLMDARYYVDLSQYPLLYGYYSRMVPGAKDLCLIDGVAALVPITLSTYSTRVDKSAVTGSVTVERTLEKLVDTMNDIPLRSGSYLFSNMNLYTLMRPWFEQLISNYMADVITDKQAEKDLKMLFKLAEEMVDNSDILLGSGASKATALLSVSQNIGIDGTLKSAQTIVPMLKISEDYKQSWNGGFYAINPNSPNKELAAMFLACLMERDRNLGFGNAQIYTDAIDPNDPIYGTGSDAMYEVYLDQLSDSIRGYEIPGFNDTLRDLFKKITGGEYSANDAAQELYRQIRMLKYE